MVKAINNGSVQILLHQLFSLFLTEEPTSGQFVKFSLQLEVLKDHIQKTIQETVP